MSLKSEYVKYALEVAFSIIAVTSVYLIDPSKTWTFVYLSAVPLLLAYTAYISSNGFQKASLTSLVTLFFIPLGPLYTVMAVFVTASNVLTSFFSKGESFRHFYGSVTLPMLFSGVLVGATVFAIFTAQPATADHFSEKASERLTAHTEQVMQQVGLNSSEAQTQLVKTVSTVTISTTQAHVINRTSRQLSPQDMQNVSNAFEEAQTEIPQQLVEEASTQGPDVQEVTDTVMQRLFTGNMLIAVIPVIAGLVYALNPLMGLLVAFTGVILRRTDSYFSETF